MKNKRGFTIVELMAVIVILAIVILIAVPSYARIQRTMKINDYKNKKALIEVAGAKYAEDTKLEYFFVNDLVLEGYLSADKEDEGLVIGWEDTIMNCYVIKAHQEEGGVFTAELQDGNPTDENSKKATEYISDDTLEGNNLAGRCDINALNKEYNKLYVNVYKLDNNNQKTDNEVTSNTRNWSNRNVILVPHWNLEEGEELGEVSYEWYSGYVPTQDKVTDKEYKIITNINVFKVIYTLKATAKTGKEYYTRVYVKIDKEAPKFKNTDAFMADETNKNSINYKWVKEYKYTPKSTDDPGSGIYGYNVIGPSTSSELGGCPTEQSSYKDKFPKKFRDDVYGKYYKVCVMDYAGNITEGNVVQIKKIDSTDLSCEISFEGTKGNVVNNVQWYIGNKVTVKNTAKALGPSGVTLTINDLASKTITYDQYENIYNKTLSNIYTTIDVTSSTPSSGILYTGTITNLAGSKANDKKTLYYEKEIQQPTYKNHTPGFDTIVVNFNMQNPPSGLKTAICKLNGQTTGTYSNGKCTYKVTATSDNTTYQASICVTSNAGNQSCSNNVPVSNKGYCTAGNYDTEEKTTYGEWGSCSTTCGTGTQSRTKTTTITATSKYEHRSCPQQSSSTSTTESTSCKSGATCCNSKKPVGMKVLKYDWYESLTNDANNYPTGDVAYYTHMAYVHVNACVVGGKYYDQDGNENPSFRIIDIHNNDGTIHSIASYDGDPNVMKKIFDYVSGGNASTTATFIGGQYWANFMDNNTNGGRVNGYTGNSSSDHFGVYAIYMNYRNAYSNVWTDPTQNHWNHIIQGTYTTDSNGNITTLSDDLWIYFPYDPGFGFSVRHWYISG